MLGAKAALAEWRGAGADRLDGCTLRGAGRAVPSVAGWLELEPSGAATATWASR